MNRPADSNLTRPTCLDAWCPHGYWPLSVRSDAEGVRLVVNTAKVWRRTFFAYILILAACSAWWLFVVPRVKLTVAGQTVIYVISVLITLLAIVGPIVGAFVKRKSMVMHEPFLIWRRNDHTLTLAERPDPILLDDVRSIDAYVWKWRLKHGSKANLGSDCAYLLVIGQGQSVSHIPIVSVESTFKRRRCARTARSLADQLGKPSQAHFDPHMYVIRGK